MKEPLQRTKVVIRHLPPSLSRSDLLALFKDQFADRYKWFCFRAGKSSYNRQKYARAYLEFKKPEDVYEFTELLNGHVFVNEKGTQFKAIVEYAPSQRVPKPCAKKDTREGTILRDPDYLEFLKLIAKPAEHLPSAENQLERKETEQAGVAKETLIITPLMEYVRQKRAAESGPTGSVAVGKVGRRRRAASASKSGSRTTKQGSEKKYILKGSAKNASRKDKSTSVAVGNREDQPASSTGKQMLESETICAVDGTVSGITLTSDTGKKKILLLKGKEREISHMPDALLPQQAETSPVENVATVTAPKQIQRRRAGGRLIRKRISNLEKIQSSSATATAQSLTAVQPLQKMQSLNLENENPPPAFINSPSGSNGHMSYNDSPAFNSDGDTKRTTDDRFARKVLHGLGAINEKQEKRTRHKDIPDRGVWTPICRSDISQANGECTSSSQPTQLGSNSIEVTDGNIEDDLSHGNKTVEVAVPASQGSRRHNGCRAVAHVIKDDGCLNTVERKSSNRKGATGSGAHKKQVWVQKSSSGR